MPDSRTPLPIVAIVGRPNVGKSTLFNRLAGRRRALVADTPGVTRDRVTAEVEISGRRILLVDTAGLDPETRDDLTVAVQAQARAALADADAILWVVDGQAGRLPEDEEVARILRRTRHPLALAVNKVDVPAHADRLGEFYQLGIEPMRGISAEHGGGAFDLFETLVEALPPPAADSASLPDGVRVAIVGRPNVGKSSLLNRLLGEQRAVVSSQPGTTRDSIDSWVERDGQGFLLVDTAGLRRPGRRTLTVERGSALMAVRALERAEVALVVIDAAEGFTDQDANISALARERGCAAALIANKWDRVEADRAPRLLEEIQHGLRFMSDTPILAVSALTGARTGRIFSAVRDLAQAAERRIPTADLNRWLEEAVQRHEPAMARRGSRRRPIRFFYASQTGVRPPTFVLFCTEPRAVAPSYRRFLENRLRERFALSGTPLRLRLRARARKARAGR